MIPWYVTTCLVEKLPEAVLPKIHHAQEIGRTFIYGLIGLIGLLLGYAGIIYNRKEK